MERIARHLAAIAVAVTLIVVVTVSMASAEGVRLDPAASADIQSRLSSAIGAGANPLGVSALSATPVIEDSIRYWTDGRNTRDVSRPLETHPGDNGGRSAIGPHRLRSAVRQDGCRHHRLLMGSSRHRQQHRDGLGLRRIDWASTTSIVFENSSGWRAKVYRTPAGVPWTIETSWTATVNGNSVSAEIPLSSLHNSKELVFLLAGIDDSSGVVDLIPDSSFGVYDIDPAWLTPVTTTTTLATTTTTLPTTTTTLATTTTTVPPSTTTTTVPSAYVHGRSAIAPVLLADQRHGVATRGRRLRERVVRSRGHGVEAAVRQDGRHRDGLSGERGEHLPVRRCGPAPG